MFAGHRKSLAEGLVYKWHLPGEIFGVTFRVNTINHFNLSNMINRKFFFDFCRINLFEGKLKQSQVDGLDTIITEWENNHHRKDDRWLAYMLATTYHETDKTMQPIEEYGKGRTRAYGKPDAVTGKAYYGRGYVQLTWKVNYATMSRVVKDDLINKPELALRTDYATMIMFYGMMNGSFTGKKLSDYFNPTTDKWISARRIINGLDKANMIADYGKKFYAAISYTT
jgi:putative chitinase